jgi:hypothetical protein
MLAAGIPVGAGTDATRVASYNPWVALYWLVSGRTVGGAALYPEANRLDRMQALRLYTVGSSWFSGEENAKGAIVPGQLADLAVLSADYFSVPEDEIKRIEAVLTLVGGKVVYGTGGFSPLAPPDPPSGVSWSPSGSYGGYGAPGRRSARAAAPSLRVAATPHGCGARGPRLWGGLGCECFAF